MIDKIRKSRPYIERPLYKERIEPFIGKEIIKVLTGQRRVGKSYILFQLMDKIEINILGSNIIYINKEFQPHSFIKNDVDLYQYVQSVLNKEKQNFLFIDEIQEIKNFEVALRSLLLENTCDIFCTGSNAKMLSGELSTFLAGRYMEFPIHSLGYEEFLIFFNLDNTTENLYKYLSLGGMPYLNVIGLHENDVYEYLRNVYSTILLKDVVSRENIRNVSFLENLVEYLADNLGNVFSATNISKYLKSQQITLTTQSVLNYLTPLINAYFIHKVSRSEVNGLKIFEVGEKYYFEDLGLRNSFQGFDRRKDINKLMENAVYLYLIGHNFKVTIGKLGANEIDFVAEKNGSKIYIQVSYLLVDEDTIVREFGNLLKIEDNYPKYVVTLDENNTRNNYKGIEQIHLRHFLCMKL
ncbi:MAG TPA: ATP-binding protein [Bacteroidales bacterium]|nr:ATP-binding protein [Bacteroidales bacterium]